MNQGRTLEVQREEFSRRRLIAMPIAGVIAWAIVGASSLFLSPFALSMTLFVATGSIAYLGMFVSKFTACRPDRIGLSLASGCSDEKQK